jgi:hypothetical protein
MMGSARWFLLATTSAVIAAACGSDEGGGGNDSRSNTGGAAGTGGFVGTGGLASGGVAGAAASGAVAGAGGAAGAAAAGGTGGAAAAGGAAGTATGGTGGMATGGLGNLDGGSTGGGASDGGVGGGEDASAPQCSYTTPAVIALMDGPSGSRVATRNGNTSDRLSRALAADCDGAPAGEGGDILYEFELDRAYDLTLTLDATFDAILRLYRGGCEAGFEVEEPGGDACSNQAGIDGGGTLESLSYAAAAAGTYFVLVDGVASGDRGTFSLEVEATCNGTDQLRLVELGIGDTDYVVLRNTSDCPARTEGVTVVFDDAEGDAAADLTVALPDVTLQPGEQLRLEENAGGGSTPDGGSSADGVIDPGDILLDPDRGGAVLVCLGDCGEGGNVMDAVAYEGEIGGPPALPPGVNFDFPLSGIDTSNKDDKAYIRVDLDGTGPNFKAGDWCTGEPGAPFAFRLEEVHVGSSDYVAIKNHADCQRSLRGYRSFFQPEVDESQHSSWGNATLASGTTYYMAENVSNDDVVNCCNVGAGENIAFAGDESGFVLLCRGTCTRPQNIIDVLAFDGPGGEDFPALPGTLTFSPDGVSGIDGSTQNSTSYFRDALTGGSPRFFRSDWTTGAASGVPE